MHRWFFFISMLLVANVSLAEISAATMRGKIVTNNPIGIRIIVTDKDGSILDMADATKSGSFKLDLSVMDSALEADIKTLLLEIRSESGLQKNVSVANYLQKFNQTVLLKPIKFNQ